LALRRLITSLPLAVLIRFLKPCALLLEIALLRLFPTSSCSLRFLNKWYYKPKRKHVSENKASFERQ
jgi:hypothetical protein